MIRKFIVSKKPFVFELYVNGQAEVKPLSVGGVIPESVTELASLHKTFIDFYSKKQKHLSVLEVAKEYFGKNGYELKETDSN